MNLLVLFGSLLLCVSLSIPIGFSIAIATTLAFLLFTDTPLTIIAQTGTTGLDSFPMMAIPLFILSGIVMTKGGVARRLVNLAQAIVGHVTGGLGMVMTLSCMFFGSISGSAPATVSAIGGMMLPEMEKKGYPIEFSSSLAAAAGSIGLIIPPSIAFVVFGVATNTSIGDLFIAAIIPGVLMTIALCIFCFIIAKKRNYPKAEHIPLKKVPMFIWDAKWAILAPVIILGGIYSGFFTPTEAAAVACVYSIIIGFFVHKELNFKGLYDALREAMVLNGIILFMLGLATGFARYLSLAQVPTKLTGLITNITDNPFLILLIINVMLLLLGMILDNIPIIIILAPMLMPIVVGTVGMNPIHFGVVMVLNTTIGLCTPPYGPNVFIACSIAGVKMEKIIKTLLLFILALIIVLAIVTYVPSVSLVLVGGMA